MNNETPIATGDPSSWKTICVADGEIPIGRASAKHAERAAKKSNMLFENSHLSKTHAKLSMSDGVLYLEDLSSTFGTIWNNYILVPYKKVAIREGDRIGFVLNRPSNSIKDLFKKANDAKMVATDILLNPSVQLLFSVVSLDSEEGSLVLLPLNGLDCLAALRKEAQAKKAAASRELSTEQEQNTAFSEEASSADDSTVSDDSDGPPVEESYVRKFTYGSQDGSIVMNAGDTQAGTVSSNDCWGATNDSSFAVSESSQSKIDLSEHDSDSGVKHETESTSNVCHSGDDKESVAWQALHDVSKGSLLNELVEDDEDDSSQDYAQLDESSDSESSDDSSVLTSSSNSAEHILKEPDCPSQLFTTLHTETDYDYNAEDEVPGNNKLETQTLRGEEKSVHFDTTTNGMFSSSIVSAKYIPNETEDVGVEAPKSDGFESDLSEDIMSSFEELCHKYDMDDDVDAAFDTLEYSSEGSASSDAESLENHESMQSCLYVEKPSTEMGKYLSDYHATTEARLHRISIISSDSSEIYELKGSDGIEMPAPITSENFVCDRVSRKRTFEEVDASHETQHDSIVAATGSAPKKAKTNSVLREITKGLFYVAGTLAVVVAYGGYLEKYGVLS